MLRVAAPFVVAVFLAAGPAFAFFQETQPATPSASTTATTPAGKLTATVTAVQGLVQVRAAEGEPFKRATVGMEVGENAEFYTGPKSAVQFVIPPDHTITLDRLGTVKVLEAVMDNGKVKTRMGMKYGRTQYDIEAAGREHESSIATPSATLSVRGTRFIAFDQRPFPAQGVSLQGRVEFRDFKKRQQFFGSRTGGKSVIDTQAASAAAYARGQTVVDPGIRLARSEGELPLVASLLSSGATVEFDYDKGIRVVRGGQVPRSDNELIPTLPGTLNFVLRWEGNADLNLGLGSANPADRPTAQSLYPVGGVNLSPNGGEIPFDHRGGANGGIEVAFWRGTPPPADFRFGSVHISGPNVPATFDVFRDGQRLTIDTPDGGTAQTVNYTAGPINPEFGSGQFVGSVKISPTESRARAKAAAVKAPVGPAIQGPAIRAKKR